MVLGKKRLGKNSPTPSAWLVVWPVLAEQLLAEQLLADRLHLFWNPKLC
jgi:hypothetical protein